MVKFLLEACRVNPEPQDRWAPLPPSLTHSLTQGGFEHFNTCHLFPVAFLLFSAPIIQQEDLLSAAVLLVQILL